MDHDLQAESAWGSNRWAKQLEDYETENETLRTQVGVLKTHLQGAEHYIAWQEEKVSELSARPERETTEKKFLGKQGRAAHQRAPERDGLEAGVEWAFGSIRHICKGSIEFRQ